MSETMLCREVWARAREVEKVQTLCRSLEIFAEKAVEVEDKSEGDGVMLKKKILPRQRPAAWVRVIHWNVGHGRTKASPK
jgi:hypothetical protein